MPRELMLLERPEQAEAVLNPLRLELLKHMDESRTCTELAHALGETPQKVHYHVKVLERAGIVEKAGERRVRAVVESYYRAVARSYWFAPSLVGRIGGPRRGDQTSLGSVLGLAEELQIDLARLGATEGETAPLAFTAQVRLARPAERTAFLGDLQNAIQSVARKYGAAGPLRPRDDPNTFRLVFACYPRPVP